MLHQIYRCGYIIIKKQTEQNRFLGSKHIKVGLARSRSQIVVFRFGDWRGGSKVDRLLKSHESQLGDLHDHGNATVGDVSLERDAFVETVWISAAVSGFCMSQWQVGRQRNRRPLMRGLLSGAAACLEPNSIFCSIGPAPPKSLAFDLGASTRDRACLPSFFLTIPPLEQEFADPSVWMRKFALTLIVCLFLPSPKNPLSRAQRHLK